MAIERYQTGFRQLTSATEQVNTMQEELTALQPVLADAQAKTGALLVEMEEKLPGVRRMKECWQRRGWPPRRWLGVYSQTT